MKKLFLLLAVIILLPLQFSYPQNSIDGAYKGKLLIAGQTLEFGVTFKTENAALTGTYEQNGATLPLSEINYNHPSLSFVLVIEQTNSKASFDGTVYKDSIAGKFKQGAYTGDFYLLSAKPEVKDTTAKKEPLPYKEEEVTFKNGENTFSGTLTLPLKEGKHPVVVMITGSGAQTRDEEILGFKVFGTIADYFTKNGIAVLRYDDRNTGKSKGTDVSESTTEDFAYDVIEAVKYLKMRSDINPVQIGLMGHSEGGIVAPLAASMNSDISFIILMAGTSVKGSDIILEQSRFIAKANGETDSVIELSNRISKNIMDVITNNGDLVQLKADLKKIFLDTFDELPEERKNSITDKEEYAEERAKGTIDMFSSKWMKYFLTYDPYPALLKVKCPVLALFGELDLQVLPSQNQALMEEGLTKSGNKDVTTKLFPKANHLFQTAITGSPNEYGTLPKEFTGDFLSYISDWILKRVTIIK